MKKFRLFTVLMAAGLFFLPSCEDSDDTAGGKGSLVVTAKMNSDESGTRADLDMTGYKVELTGEESRTLDYPTDGIINDLEAGSYTVKLSNLPTTYQPAFNDPRYAGSKDVTVSGGKTTEVEILLKQANTAILFKFDNSLDPEEFDIQPRVQQNLKTLTFSGDNKEKLGYFAPGDATLTFWNGDVQLAIDGSHNRVLNCEPGQILEVTLSANEEGADSPIKASTKVPGDSGDGEEWNVGGSMYFVDVEISDITAASFLAHTTPKEEVKHYLTYVCGLDWWKSYENRPVEDQILYVMDRVGAGAARLLRQEYTLKESLGNACASNHVYIVVAIGHDDEPVGDLRRIDIRTPDLVENPAPASMEIKIVEVTSTTATVDFIMGPNTISYYPSVTMAGDSYASDRSSQLWVMDYFYEFEIEDVTLRFENLKPGTEYGVWAFGCGVNGDQPGAGAYFDVFFTTPQ